MLGHSGGVPGDALKNTTLLGVGFALYAGRVCSQFLLQDWERGPWVARIYTVFFFPLFSDRRFVGIVCSCVRCTMTNSDNSCHLGLPYSVLGSPEPACSHVSPPSLTNSSRLSFLYLLFFSVLVSFCFVLFYFFRFFRPYLLLWEIIF